MSPSACIIWRGAKNSRGYGQVRQGGRVRLVHRVSYEKNVGPIPTGLQIDHLCRNPACYNPQHLEAVTPGENTRRGLAGHHNKAKRLRTHCKHGHEFAPENIYWSPTTGARECRACRVAAKLAFHNREKELV